MLSEGQLSIFEQLARVPAQRTPLAALPESIDSLFKLPNDDTIRFK
jgi:hypothetical protein